MGGAKAASASAAVRALNSGVRVVTHPAVTPANAAALVASYDCVLDCTDNAASRYLLSDAAAAARVPLVSGAAVGTEGQLTVLCGPCDDPATAAPCYRCLFPTPAPPAHCARCADAGVLGPVPGLIGTLQAVEAIKLLTRSGEPLRGRMLLYDALSARPFYVTRTRPRDAGCAACGEEGKRLEALRGEALCTYDYAAFVAGTVQTAPEVARPPLRRVTVAAYAAVAAAGGAHLLVDVRPRHMCVTCIHHVNAPCMHARLLTQRRSGSKRRRCEARTACRTTALRRLRMRSRNASQTTLAAMPTPMRMPMPMRVRMRRRACSSSAGAATSRRRALQTA